MVSGNRQSIKRSFKGAAGNFLFPIEIQRAFRTTLERWGLCWQMIALAVKEQMTPSTSLIPVALGRKFSIGRFLGCNSEGPLKAQAGFLFVIYIAMLCRSRSQPSKPTWPHFTGELRAPEFMSLFEPPQPISVRGKPWSCNCWFLLLGSFPHAGWVPSCRDICSEAFVPEEWHDIFQHLLH